MSEESTPDRAQTDEEMKDLEVDDEDAEAVTGGQRGGDDMPTES